MLHTVMSEPVFETGLLLAGRIDPFDVRKQLTRWTASGKIHQLRRGLYCLAEPYQKIVPHPFMVANRFVGGSYISLQSALAYYDMIPEYVPMTTSVTTGRAATYDTPLGQFDFRHIQVNWLHGYHRVALENGQEAFIASPEKALLDLVYLQPGGDEESYLRSLRLQALDQLNLEKLEQLSIKSGKPKIARAVNVLRRLVDEENSGYRIL